jgi:predicted RNase H-like nuclease (RuvC/YqgF family)
MTDIVERLRATEPNARDMQDAADEIERLRAQLDFVMQDRAKEVARRDAEIERLRVLNDAQDRTIDRLERRSEKP